MRAVALAAAAASVLGTMSVEEAKARLKEATDPVERERLRLEWQRAYAANVTRRHESYRPKRQPTTDLDHELIRLAQQKRARKAAKLRAAFSTQRGV